MQALPPNTSKTLAQAGHSVDQGRGKPIGVPSVATIQQHERSPSETRLRRTVVIAHIIPSKLATVRRVNQGVEGITVTMHARPFLHRAVHRQLTTGHRPHRSTLTFPARGRRVVAGGGPPLPHETDRGKKYAVARYLLIQHVSALTRVDRLLRRALAQQKL